MFVKLVQKGGMHRTKTISQYENIPDTNDIDWDDSSNGMNDHYESVTTSSGVWIYLFQNTSYGDTGQNILVPPNSTNFDLQANGFDEKVGSFKICDHDPTLVEEEPEALNAYRPYYPTAIDPYKTYIICREALTPSTYSRLTFTNESLVLDGTASPTLAGLKNDAPLNSRWQFFEVSNGNYVIANCQTGQLLYKTNEQNPLDPEGGMCMTVGNNTDQCGVYNITQLTEDTLNPEVIGDTVAIRDSTGAGDTFLTVDFDSETSKYGGIYEAIGNQTSNCEWYLIPYGDVEQPPVQQPVRLDLPAFNDNGIAPPVWPLQPETVNRVWVPYFMVNDKTMKNWGDRIKHSPYYLLIQKAQYKMAASVMNCTNSDDSFNENWTYGWSEDISESVSADLGFTLGDEFEASILVVKDTISAGISGDLGISFSVSIGASGSNSKDVSVNIPAQSCVAFYGVQTTYELYQMNGVSCVATPDVPLKMDNNFLTIQGELPA